MTPSARFQRGFYARSIRAYVSSSAFRNFAEAELEDAARGAYLLAGARRPRQPLFRRAAYTQRTRVVYNWCVSRVRTNIEIEDTYVQAIMERFGVRTKTEAVDLALRHLAGQPMTREEALAMQGAHVLLEPPADAPPRGAR